LRETGQGTQSTGLVEVDPKEMAVYIGKEKRQGIKVGERVQRKIKIKD
jgi:hypothetical protein